MFNIENARVEKKSQMKTIFLQLKKKLAVIYVFELVFANFIENKALTLNNWFLLIKKLTEIKFKNSIENSVCTNRVPNFRKKNFHKSLKFKCFFC